MFFAQLLAKMTDDRLALLVDVIPIRDVCDIVIDYVPLFQGKQVHQLTWCKDAAVGEIYRLSDTRVVIQSLDGVLSIWDLVTNSCMQTIEQRGGAKHAAAIHENLLASVGPLGVMVWGIDGFLRAKQMSLGPRGKTSRNLFKQKTLHCEIHGNPSKNPSRVPKSSRTNLLRTQFLGESKTFFFLLHSL